MGVAPQSFRMTRAISVVVLSLIIAFALTSYTVKKSTKRPAAIYWCFDPTVGAGLPCKYVRAERAI